MLVRWWCCVSLLVVVSCSGETNAGEGTVIDESIVETVFGSVRGVVFDTYRAFKGVPYVAPPVGNLRWARSETPQPWSGTLDCTSFKPGCPQNYTCPDTQSEDCLYLNVYTPRLLNLTTLQPVMVFLPGGHFEQGTAGCLLYDGSTIVTSSNALLVTVNYRLGFLGWYTNVDQDVTGNFGFYDQLMALQWVQTNIAKFGGDPTKVTLFGQSAGSTSTRAHLISPLSKGLFHQVIMQSDPLPLPLRDLVDASSFGRSFMNQLGCTDMSCMRNKAITELLAAQKVVQKNINLLRPIEMFLPWVPTVDSNIIPYHTFEAFQNGYFNKVPIIIGDVSEDALLFIYKAANFSLNDLEYESILAFIFKEEAFNVSYQYPPTPIIGDKRPQLGVLATHYIFECAARYLQELLYKADPTNSLYLYQWDHAIDPQLWGPTYYYCDDHVCHGSELAFEFAGIDLQKIVKFTDAEQTLSKSIMGYYTNFARTGNPNNGPYTPQLQWPQWDPSSLSSMHFSTPQNNIQSGLLKSQCNFWDSLGYSYGW